MNEESNDLAVESIQMDGDTTAIEEDKVVEKPNDPIEQIEQEQEEKTTLIVQTINEDDNAVKDAEQPIVETKKTISVPTQKKNASSSIKIKNFN